VVELEAIGLRSAVSLLVEELQLKKNYELILEIAT
jgi:hypothetical protein